MDNGPPAGHFEDPIALINGSKHYYSALGSGSRGTTGFERVASKIRDVDIGLFLEILEF